MAAPAYGDGALGRLAFSQACRDLSDLARAHVPTSADGHQGPGELVGEALRLIHCAEYAMRMAVVAERLRGASWAQMADALGLSPDSVSGRYADAEREVRDALLFPDRDGRDGTPGWWACPDGLDDPEATARDLDAWERRHRERTDPDRGAAAVSPGLARRGTLDEIGAVTTIAGMFIDGELPDCVSRARAEQVLCERRVRVFERLLAERPDSTEMQTALRDAKARLVGRTMRTGR